MGSRASTRSPHDSPHTAAGHGHDRVFEPHRILDAWIKAHKLASVLIAVGLVIVLAVILSAVSAAHTSGSGFHNMSALQQSVTQQENKSLAGTGGRVKQVVCVPSGSNTAICNVTDSLGESTSLNITIAPDGNSWVSH